jgi:hypothetical protein
MWEFWMFVLTGGHLGRHLEQRKMLKGAKMASRRFLM